MTAGQSGLALSVKVNSKHDDHVRDGKGKDPVAFENRPLGTAPCTRSYIYLIVLSLKWICCMCIRIFGTRNRVLTTRNPIMSVATGQFISYDLIPDQRSALASHVKQRTLVAMDNSIWQAVWNGYLEEKEPDFLSILLVNDTAYLLRQ